MTAKACKKKLEFITNFSCTIRSLLKFFLQKLTFFIVYIFFDNFWQLLTSFDRFWQIVTSFDIFWQLLTFDIVWTFKNGQKNYFYPQLSITSKTRVQKSLQKVLSASVIVYVDPKLIIFFVVYESLYKSNSKN